MAEEAVVEEAVVAEDVVGDGEAAIFSTTGKAIVNVKIADVPPEAATEITPEVAIEITAVPACHLC
jgi:hypothetical protein